MFALNRSARLAVLWLIFLLLVAELLSFSVLVIQAPVEGDLPLFLAVGRGMLNGLSPWRDLLETKPPVVFWISAFSLLLSGDKTVYHLVFVSGLAGMAAVLCLSSQPGRRWMAAILGLSLATFIFWGARGYWVEGFTAFPAALALVAFRKGGWKWGLLAAACFAILGLTREPVVLPLIAAFLLLVRKRKDVLSLAAILAAGGLMALLLLGCTGLFHEYFSVYVPDMRAFKMAHFSSSSLLPSPFLSGFFFYGLLKLFLGPSLGIGLALLCMGAHYLRLRTGQPYKLIALALLLLGAAGFAGSLLYTFADTAISVHRIPSGLRMAFLVLSLITAGVLAVVLFLRSRRLLLHTLFLFLCIYVGNYAGSMGVFSEKHMLVFLPLWIVLIFLFVTSSPHRLLDAAALIGVAWTLVAYSFGATSLLYPANLHAIGLVDGRRAALMDTVLDRCGIAQYMPLTDTVFVRAVGLTKHSPFQLFAGMDRTRPSMRYTLTPASPMFQEFLAEDWQAAEVVVTADPPDGFFELREPEFDQHFSTAVPSCAKEALKDGQEGMRLYFRTPLFERGR